MVDGWLGELSDEREEATMPHDNARHVMLMDMMRHDPDGGCVEPTERDYAQFESWARNTYGVDAWDLYRGGSWLPARAEV